MIGQPYNKSQITSIAAQAADQIVQHLSSALREASSKYVEILISEHDTTERTSLEDGTELPLLVPVSMNPMERSLLLLIGGLEKQGTISSIRGLAASSDDAFDVPHHLIQLRLKGLVVRASGPGGDCPSFMLTEVGRYLYSFIVDLSSDD